MANILCVGNAVRDIFLTSSYFETIRSSRFTTGVGECVALGSKVEVESLTMATGGGATNAAVTFARLGHLAKVMAAVGDDESGRIITNDLQKEGVDVSLLAKVPEAQTAVSVLLTTGEGERTALVFRGVNHQLKKFLPKAWPATDWVYISSLGGDLDLLEEVIKKAQKGKAKIAINPGVAELKESLSLRRILAKIEVVILNLEEAKELTRQKLADDWRLAEEIAEENQTVIITDGPRGVTVKSPGGGFHALGYDVPVVSQTGAGDALGAGVVAGLAAGRSIIEAVKGGVINAQNVIGKVGAKTGIIKSWPLEKELNRVIITPYD